MDDEKEKPARDEKGRLLKGHSGNPSGRPKIWQDYQQFLKDKALPLAQAALLTMLKGESGAPAQVAAVREVNDRLFGRAPIMVEDADGNERKGFGIVILPAESDE